MKPAAWCGAVALLFSSLLGGCACSHGACRPHHAEHARKKCCGRGAATSAQHEPCEGEQGSASADEHPNPHEEAFRVRLARLEDPGRDTWQKPDVLVAALGASGKVVADLHASNGYFALRLLADAQRVIATETDERMLAYVLGRVAALPKPQQDKLTLRRVGTDRPGLVPEEAEVALLVDAYHGLGDRVNWLRALAAGLKPGAEIVIVDRKLEEGADESAAAMHVDPQVIVDELREAGFESPSVDSALLPRQYLVRARTPKP